MAEAQPPTIVEGATTGDIDDEIPVAAKSAEDRKTAAALSSLDAPREDDSAATKDVDREAVRKAMDRLAGSGAANGTASKKGEDKQTPRKVVKVDQSDVTLLVCPAINQLWSPVFSNGMRGAVLLENISLASLSQPFTHARLEDKIICHILGSPG
jgi:hypothetical protein